MFNITKFAYKIIKLRHTCILLKPCLIKKFETICAKEIIPFVPSIKLYRVFIQETLGIVYFSTEC
jgi:hypothetical protein